MKSILVLFISLMITACSSTKNTNSYQVSSTVHALGKQQYLVSFKVLENDCVFIADNPRIQLSAGEPGTIMFHDEGEINSLSCIAEIHESTSGLEATTIVRIKKNGTEVFSSSQKNTVPQLAVK